MMYIGRFIAGLGIGTLSLVAPMYISESAPTQVRGRLVCFQQLAITFGIMISFFMDLGFKETGKYGWRYALGGQWAFGFVMFGLVLCVPESPRFLVKQGRINKADRCLKKLRALDNVDRELSIIVQQVDYEQKIGQCSWTQMFGKEYIFRVLFGATVLMFQQFSGINVIMYYAPKIFSLLKLPSTLFNSFVGIMNFLATFLALWLVDRAGRRKLMLFGAVGMFLGHMGCAATALSAGESDTAGGYIIMVFIFFFIVNYAYSWGPVAWLIPAEIYPIRVRGKALSVTTFSNWIFNFAVSMFANPMLNSWNIGYCFLFFAAWCAIMGLYMYLLFPETKGRTLENVDQLFKVQSVRDLKCHVKRVVAAK